MDILVFKSDMQRAVDSFFDKCFSAVGIPYSPKDRHIDIVQWSSLFVTPEPNYFTPNLFS